MRESDGKKLYIAPEMNVSKLDKSDVVRTSETAASWKNGWGEGNGDYFVPERKTGGEL